MTMYIFDESDEYYRAPGGAIATPGKLELKIKIQRGCSSHVRIRMFIDGGTARETVMDYSGSVGAYDVYSSTIGIDAPGLYWYSLQICSGDGTVCAVPEHTGGNFQITAYDSACKTPDWIKGGLIYHIFIDRFNRGGRFGADGRPAGLRDDAVYRTDWGGCPAFRPDEEGIIRNNDFFGGDIYGVIEKLPYLESLGVTCIYLSPVFEAASNHKYDTGDFMKVDAGFGGDEALQKLCKDADELGMKVILDGVFNHVGSDSRYFNRYDNYDGAGAYRGAGSPYYDWFTFKEDGTYEAWWGIKLLPTMNKLAESYREYICGFDGVIAHWMKKGVSGWRLDVVDELPDVFLDPLCARMKAENHDAFIVGEVWEDASHKIAYSTRRRYFLGGQLDSVTNYPLKNSIIACVKEGNILQLAETMAALNRNYPAGVLHSLMNILGTHDTMRILTALSDSDFPEGREAMSGFYLTDEQTRVAIKRLKLASTLQFTLPGVPCLYYGDEAGMDGGADPFNRRCYPWGAENGELVSWYTNLSRQRKERSCFKDGKYELVEARAGLFAFTRGQGNDRVLVAINVSDSDRFLWSEGFNYDLLKYEYTDDIVVKAGEPGIFAIKGDDPIK